MLVTYDDVLRAAEDSKTHDETGNRYVAVILHEGDTAEVPLGVTVFGPGMWLWQLSPNTTAALAYDSEADMPRKLLDGAAVIDTVVVSSHYTEPRS